MPNSSCLDELKTQWLKEGWMRVSARENKQGDRLLISGFLYPPESGATQRLKLSDGHDPDTLYGLSNPDHDYLGANAFETSIDLRDLRPGSVLSISSTSNPLDQAIPWHQSWYLLPPDNIPFPPKSNLQRITQQGADNQWWHFAGGTFVHKIGRVLEKYFSMDFGRIGSVLDWGCGCGRLTRHMSKYTDAQLYGIDIDPQNVDWCSRNFPMARFSLADPWKPAPYDNKSFDLIIGHSVLTHLTEQAQQFWLEELHRILKPGGVLLVTVMSRFSILSERLSNPAIEKLLLAGYLDVGNQTSYLDKSRPGYYRKVFHSREYIQANWSNRFAVLDVLDGYADHQSMVVCKRPDI